MARLSMSDLWDETRAYVRREASLLLPVGLATFGLPSLVMGTLVPRPTGPSASPADQLVAQGPWAYAMIPVALFILLGSLTVSAMVLRPGISVGEALRHALRRLFPGVLAILLLSVIGTAIVMLAAAISAAVAAGVGWGTQQASAFLVLLLIPMVAWVMIQTSLMWPILAAGQPSALIAFRQSLRWARRHFMRMLAVTVVFWLAYVAILGLTQLALGSIVLIGGRLLGVPEEAQTLVIAITAGIAAIVQTIWVVFWARLYARLAADEGSSISGT